jgi:hypothetical protein
MIEKLEASEQRSGDIEENIKRKRLRDAEREKKNLAEKLKFLDEEIAEIDSGEVKEEEVKPIPKRPDLRDSSTRKAFVEEERARTKAVAAHTKRLREESYARERKHRNDLLKQ